MDYANYKERPLARLYQTTGHTVASSVQWGILTLQGYLKVLGNKALGVSDWRTNDPEGEENDLPVLFDTNKGLYIRLLYSGVEDTFNRPIASTPDAYIDCIIREADPKMNGWFGKRLVCTSRTKRCLNLSSYNYLGFGGLNEYATHHVVRALKTLPISSCSTMAECGYLPVHRELEEMVAKFLAKEDAAVIGMGFGTNSTVLPALVGRGDLILSDALNHTSIVQGARESGAKIKAFIHNDEVDLERLLQDALMGPKRYGKILVVIEGIYSMEGELCRLKQLVTVAKRYGAYVYLDEAHSIGCVGKTGRGVAEELGVDSSQIDIFMGTFSKSFGSTGGYIAASKGVCDAIRAYAAGCTDAATMAPACAVQIIEALRVIQGSDGTDIGQTKLRAIRENAAFFRKGLEDIGLEVLGNNPSPVIPVMLYNPFKIGDFSRLAFQRGLAVVSVGAPAVPLMYSRVRFCISAAHTREDLAWALVQVKQIAEILELRYISKPPSSHMPGTLHEEEKEAAKKQAKMTVGVAANRAAALAAAKISVWKPLEGATKVSELSVRVAVETEKSKWDVSTCDFYGFRSDKTVVEACVKTVQAKGCGSCGPRGFYGTFPEHMDLESQLAKFMRVEEAVLYPFGACTVSSVIACMAAREDVLVVDEGVSRNITSGLNLSRAEVRYYRHCDATSARKVLEQLAREDMGGKRRRNFIVSEALFAGSGKLAPLPKLAALRLEFKCRFILDESLSFGVMGETGRGALEHFGLAPGSVDVLAASLENVGASMTGFACGPTGVVAYQRLLGSGYCFSASIPPYLASASSAAVAILDEEKSGKARVAKLRDAAALLNKKLRFVPGLKTNADPESHCIPMRLSRSSGDTVEDTRLLEEICAHSRGKGLRVCVARYPVRAGEVKLPTGIARAQGRSRRDGRRALPATFLRVYASASLADKDIENICGILTSACENVLGETISSSVSPVKGDHKARRSQLLELESETEAEDADEDLLPEAAAKLSTGDKHQKVVMREGENAAGYMQWQLPIFVAFTYVFCILRRYLIGQNMVTLRLTSGWLRNLGLLRGNGQGVRGSLWMPWIGSLKFFEVVGPLVFWMFNCSKVQVIVITYCVSSCVGLALKSLMATSSNAVRAPGGTWPSVDAMNALVIPFFVLRWWSWQYVKTRWDATASYLHVAFVVLAIAWVAVVCVGRLVKGDSPANLQGGLIIGAVAIHLWSPIADQLHETLRSGEFWHFNAATLVGLVILLLFPLPLDRERSNGVLQPIGRDCYWRACKTVTFMLLFMLGTFVHSGQGSVRPITLWGMLLYSTVGYLAVYLAAQVMCFVCLRMNRAFRVCCEAFKGCCVGAASRSASKDPPAAHITDSSVAELCRAGTIGIMMSAGVPALMGALN